MKFSDGTLPNGTVQNVRASSGTQYIEVIAKPGEQCNYTIATNWRTDINAGIRFDDEILHIYEHDGIWKDSLNPNTGSGEEALTYCGLDRNFTIAENYLMRKFYIPQYLCTKNSYPNSIGKTQYQLIMEIAQESYFYRMVYGTAEQVEVVGTIYITTSAPSGGAPEPTPPTPSDTIISVLDELRAKLKIRLK